jgi:hypothetical protein
MPHTCTICDHVELPAITQALADGTSYRELAQRYHVGRSTIGRHVQHAQGREGLPRASSRVYAAHGVNFTTGPIGTAPRGDWQALVREAQHLQDLILREDAQLRQWHYVRSLARLITKMTRTAAQQCP